LRFPLLIITGCDLIKLPDDIVFETFLNGTYLLSAILIAYECKRLSNFNIDFFSMLLFIGIPLISPFVATIGELFNLDIYTAYISKFRIIVALLLSLSLIILRPKFEKKKLSKVILWLILVFIIGLVFSIMQAYLYCRQTHVGFVLKTKYDLSLAITFFLQQIGSAAISEEPLFRGFIWGYLKNRNWKWYWILFFQALLFIIGHLYHLYSGNLYSFFIIVPIGGLLFGFIAYRSKSIGNSMICHGLLNALSVIIAFRGWM
jgi:membrane protease YdiL (CAAX protease family)